MESDGFLFATMNAKWGAARALCLPNRELNMDPSASKKRQSSLPKFVTLR